MTPTHAMVGAAVGALAVSVAPGLGHAAVVAGVVGGAVPDLDLLWTHRRTTHFPVYAPAVTLPLVPLALLSGSLAAALVAVFAVALAVHPVMDVLCGGVELRPWEATSERAVYDHARGRWLRPRRVVRYAGAPEDFLFAAAFATPAIAVTTGRLRGVLVAVLIVSGAFVAVRRRLVPLTERLFAEDTREA